MLREHAISLINDGLCRIRQAVPGALCDAVREDYRRHRASPADADLSLDKDGHHTRLANFHLVSESARQVGTHEPVMRLLDLLLGYRTQIWSSLIFERATEQALQRDAPFFRTAPENFFLGVQTALEDIGDHAGPMQYYRGGHRIEVDPDAIATEVRALSRDDRGEKEFLDDCFELYQHRVIRKAKERELTLARSSLKKGDTVIWHPLLPHGDSHVEDPSLSRASIVFHVQPENTPMYGFSVFFGLQEGPIPDTVTALDYNGRRYVDHGASQFFPDL